MLKKLINIEARPGRENREKEGIGMKRSDYLKRAMETYDSGRISEEAYDSMLRNADYFCDDDESEYSELD